jgi:ribosomal-protein-alanine N-acetyltransferase
MLSFLRPGSRDAPMLRHGRVYLRPAKASDWRAWAALRRESRNFLEPWEPTWPYDALSRAAFRRRLAQYRAEMREDTGYAFLVFRKQDDGLLGGVSMSNIRRGVAQSASLGYWIGQPHARRGYMTEALLAVLEFGFDQLGLHRIEAACLPGNTASRRLLARVGFTEEGYAREYLRINGVWQDHVLFAILRHDPRGTSGADGPRAGPSGQ